MDTANGHVNQGFRPETGYPAVYTVDKPDVSVTGKDAVSLEPVPVKEETPVEIKPGQKGDPYFRFRVGKQAALVATWICMVGIKMI